MDGLLLAGGKSSRMGGRHKGDLLYGNETFTTRMIHEFSKDADTIWISYGAKVYGTYENCRIVRDIYPDCGPIGGIHAGLTACESDEVMVAACDMPFLKIELFRYLYKQMEEAGKQEKVAYDGAVSVLDGRIHPLSAIYRKTAALVMEQQILNGNYRIRAALDRMKILYVDVTGNDRFAYMLQNVNTVEEYRKINAATGFNK